MAARGSPFGDAEAAHPFTGRPLARFPAEGWSFSSDPGPMARPGNAAASRVTSSVAVDTLVPGAGAAFFFFFFFFFFFW